MRAITSLYEEEWCDRREIVVDNVRQLMRMVSSVMRFSFVRIC